MRGKVPHVVVSLWGIPRRVPRALVIQGGSSRDKESRVQGTRTRNEEKMGLVMWWGRIVTSTWP